MKNSKIEWCDHTVNFWWGCEYARLADDTVSPECVNCYAKRLALVFAAGKATWGRDGLRRIRHEAARRELYRLDKEAYRAGRRIRVFINSMSDTFEDRPDLLEARGLLWDACKFVTNTDILLLTKRPENIARMVPKEWLSNWPAHVITGTTAGTQKSANERIPKLISVPGRHFLSMEPLLEGVTLDDSWIGHYHAEWGGFYPYSLHWVIVGGESGNKARPMRPNWVRRLRDACKSAGVPFFFKQWGEWSWDGSIPEDPIRIGKKEAGRLLDGTEHNEFPKGVA